MNIAIILNGISPKKKIFYQSILPAIQDKFRVEVFETQFANHAYQLAADAVENEFDMILSAGGDGTLNQVLNGMMRIGHQNQLPTLGLIPLGSGNDFANTVGLKVNADYIIELLSKNKPKPTDIGKIACRGSEGQDELRYFINVCSMGMGPATVTQMKRASPWLSADLRYLQSIIRVFFSHTPEPIEIKTSKKQWSGSARVFAIANGKSFGSKIYIAPDAKPDDGEFSTFLASDMPLFKFLYILQLIKKCKKVDDPRIIYSTATRLEITSSQQVALEAEGELMGFLPAIIEVYSNQINFLR